MHLWLAEETYFKNNSIVLIFIVIIILDYYCFKCFFICLFMGKEKQ